MTATSLQRNVLPTPFTFSQSSLQDYTDCPRRFQLRYIQQLAWPAVETEPVHEYERHQQEGLFFHRLIQQHLIGISDEILTQLANTSNLNCLWKNYLQRGPDLTNYSKHIEITLSAPIDKHRLTAKYDLIAISPCKIAFIYDWKTYQKKPRIEWLVARYQTRVYRALLVQAGAYLNNNKPFKPEQVEMIFWMVNFPNDPVCLPYTAAQYNRDWDDLKNVVKEITTTRFFPLTTDAKTCRFCPYRSYCNRGDKAGTWDETIDFEENARLDLEIKFEQISEIEF